MAEQNPIDFCLTTYWNKLQFQKKIENFEKSWNELLKNK